MADPLVPGAGPASVSKQAASDWSLSIGRSVGAVVVKVTGDITEALTVTLAHVLSDLIDGQGNIFVAVELPEAAIGDRKVRTMMSTLVSAASGHVGQLVIRPSIGRTT